ncbi:MAG: hypothetical protein EOP04_30970, partial [Proteobacteria bacterium]
MEEPQYHFRFRGKIFGPGTIAQLTANPLLLQSDAANIEACRDGETNWTPLEELVNFTKPWRALDVVEGGYINLPKFPASPKERLLGSIFSYTGGVDLEKDALRPFWSTAIFYHWRWAGTKKTFTPLLLRKLVLYPPFPKNDAWRIEVRRSMSRIWVPLPSLIDFSQGWPVVPEDIKPDLPSPQASEDPSRTESKLEPTGIFLVSILVIGIVLAGYALSIKTEIPSYFNGIH